MIAPLPVRERRRKGAAATGACRTRSRAHGAHSTDMSWDVMFCHAGRRDPMGYVMKCHVLHVHGACPLAGSCMKRSFRPRVPGIPSCFPGSASSAWVLPFGPSSFRSSCLRLGGGTLIRAYPARACAGAGARFAAARLARLIAPARPCARTRRRAHVSRWPNQGLFFRRRESKRPPDAAPFLPPLYGQSTSRGQPYL